MSRMNVRAPRGHKRCRLSPIGRYPLVDILVNSGIPPARRLTKDDLRRIAESHQTWNRRMKPHYDAIKASTLITGEDRALRVYASTSKKKKGPG